MTGTNQTLADHPELINQSPYGEGWIIELKVSRMEEEKGTLMTPMQYREFLASLEAQQAG